MKGSAKEASYDDVQRILTQIRRQYDEVHCEANKRETELIEVRRDIRILDGETKSQEDTWNGFNRKGVIQKLDEATVELEAAMEVKKVYEHMVERLTREQRIMQQKVALLEQHLHRKTREVEHRQFDSRRVHEEKVGLITKLEEMEQDINLERMVCNGALNDLEAALTRRRNEVRHREDFENWRYEVAMEAATEAFEATAGRYRKIYAIEKLTGNCLQKLTFEQAEQSQVTEDGFQRIREVTGLTDVMDIVHKFLNRNTEHEQLRSAVREAEAKLHSLREAEASRPSGDGMLGSKFETRGLGTEVADWEQYLDEARRDHGDLRQALKEGTLLLDNVQRWAHKVAKSLAPVKDIPPIREVSDIPNFFAQLVSTVDRFMDMAHAEMPDARLVKMTSEAYERTFTDQQKLLMDKEFLRCNCRITASQDNQIKEDGKKKKDGNLPAEDERLDLEFNTDRERMKQQASAKLMDTKTKSSLQGASKQRALA